jgi:RES domain-containing protein
MVYTSGSLSLAALETLVHADEDLLPSDLVYVEIDVPDNVKMERIAARSLPSDWRRMPAPPSLQAIGADWIDRRVSAVLVVPSAVVPQENNYLLNPEHADAARFRVVGVERFLFDPRPRR